MKLVDNFGRTIDSLRVSVTDRCNFHCSYCMPKENITWIPPQEILSFEELDRLIKLLVPLGIMKYKITGGEPLLRRDLHTFLKMLHDIDGVNDVSLTTNGYFLDSQARFLKDAGLKRITVSLDSLREDRFNSLVQRDIFRKIYNNLMLIMEMNFSPVKINTVVIRDINDDEIVDYIRFAQETGIIVRFIEYMPFEAAGKWTQKKVVPHHEIRAIIKRHFAVEPSQTAVEAAAHGTPATRYRLSDGSAEFGIISSISSPFCSSCGRIRLTAEGKLRTCLFSDNETDIKLLLRSGAEDSEIVDIIRSAVQQRVEGHDLREGAVHGPSRPMSRIGG
ncbi:GTP 3',8-cyclase MoaA [candidate division KSB1 bacterium]